MIQQLQKNCPTNQRLNHLPFKFSKIKLKYMFQLNWFSHWKLTIVPNMMFFFVLNPQLSPITSFRRPVLTPKQTWLTWRMTVSPIPAETWPCAESSQIISQKMYLTWRICKPSKSEPLVYTRLLHWKIRNFWLLLICMVVNSLNLASFAFLEVPACTFYCVLCFGGKKLVVNRPG